MLNDAVKSRIESEHATLRVRRRKVNWGFRVYALRKVLSRLVSRDRWQILRTDPA
jgi:hypothetical protein